MALEHPRARAARLTNIFVAVRRYCYYFDLSNDASSGDVTLVIDNLACDDYGDAEAAALVSATSTVLDGVATLGANTECVAIENTLTLVLSSFSCDDYGEAEESIVLAATSDLLDGTATLGDSTECVASDDEPNSAEIVLTFDLDDSAEQPGAVVMNVGTNGRPSGWCPAAR